MQNISRGVGQASMDCIQPSPSLKVKMTQATKRASQAHFGVCLEELNTTGSISSNIVEDVGEGKESRNIKVGGRKCKTQKSKDGIAKRIFRKTQTMVAYTSEKVHALRSELAVGPSGAHTVPVTAVTKQPEDVVKLDGENITSSASLALSHCRSFVGELPVFKSDRKTLTVPGNDLTLGVRKFSSICSFNIDDDMLQSTRGSFNGIPSARKVFRNKSSAAVVGKKDQEALMNSAARRRTNSVSAGHRLSGVQ